MALSNAPYGFRPYRHLAGGDSQRFREYPVATGYTTAIGEGDVVKLLTDGTIAVAAAGERALGVFVGVRYVASDGSQVFTNRWPASTAATDIRASVVTDPLTTFRVQSGGTPTSADVGTLADHVTGTPSTTSGGSTAYLSGTMTSGAASFRVLGIIPEPSNSGQYASLEVQLHEHEFSTAVAGTPGV